MPSADPVTGGNGWVSRAKNNRREAGWFSLVNSKPSTLLVKVLGVFICEMWEGPACPNDRGRSHIARAPTDSTSDLQLLGRNFRLR